MCQTKNSFTNCGSHKNFVPDKRWLAFSKIGFCAGTKLFEESLKAVKFLCWLKKLTVTKHFGTCRRTRHKPTYLKLFRSILFNSHYIWQIVSNSFALQLQGWLVQRRCSDKSSKHKTWKSCHFSNNFNDLTLSFKVLMFSDVSLVLFSLLM